MENLYEILQVSKKASKEVIEKSYKTLAKKYHPDIAKNKEKAEEMMKKINNAYDILGDEFKRKEYDQQLQTETINNSYNYNQTTQTKYNQSSNTMNNHNNYDTYHRYNYKTNNMYDEYNYNDKYDYMNNPDIFNRLFDLNTTSRKVLILILIIVFILLIKLIFDIKNFLLVGDKEDITNNIPNVSDSNTLISNYPYYDEEQFISNQKLADLFIDYMNDIKQFNIEKLNIYLAKEYKITDEEFENMISNEKIINKLTNNMKIIISNPRSSNLNRGTIQIEVTRIDLDFVLLEVSKDIWMNYNNLQYNKEKINNLILKYMEVNKDKTRTVNATINFIKENETWKIQFSNNDFYNIFGYNIKGQI